MIETREDRWMNLRAFAHLRRTVAREVALVKDSMLREHSLLSDRIVKSPTSNTSRVANKDTLLDMNARSISFILLHMHISKAAPNPKVLHIWLRLVPQFKRSFVLRNVRSRVHV